MRRALLGERKRPVVRAVLAVIPWIAVVAALVTGLGARAGLAAGLFQSELLPTASAPVATPGGTVAAPEATASPAPVTDTPAAPVPSATEAPTATQIPSPTPAAPVPVRATAILPTRAARPQASQADERYPAQPARLAFDWRLFFDSLALGASWLWLGCGVLVLVVAVPFFWALWRAGRRRRE